jgi:hypothetical protein
MKYTIVANWGWWKHDNCKGAYSLHNSNCKVVKSRDEYNSQGIIGEFDDVKTAVLTTYQDDTVCRFDEALSQFGFWQMLTVCKCSMETKTSVKAIVGDLQEV